MPDYGVVGLDTLAPTQRIPYPARYLFGFIVDLYWMKDYGERIIAAGRGRVGRDPVDCAQAWIRTHCRYVNMNVIHPRKGLDVFCWWIGTNQVEWALDTAENPEIRQKLRDALSTDTEPKWYATRRPPRR